MPADRHTAALAALAELGLPEPFPWQRALLKALVAGSPPSALDIPTGLGKTSVMVLWLAARAVGAKLPRRLVYVVDRRAIVDQATTEAERLRARLEAHPQLRAVLGLEAPLPISTLRGQFADNREWLADPSAPAIILGTVDMIGSRLLFEGYAASRKMRPYHAGLLGVDVLVALDEAHLVQPFHRLLSAIEARVRADKPSAEGLGPVSGRAKGALPEFRLIALSATGLREATALGLSDEDRVHPVVSQRLSAVKALEVLDPVDPKALAQTLAERAFELAASGGRRRRCLVFVDRRDDAVKVCDALRRLDPSRRGRSISVELLVGARRVWERQKAHDWLVRSGFIAGTGAAPTQPTILVATSAGEVGVDLDADDMVCDVVAWERMVQRLGRVNRRGTGRGRILAVPVELDSVKQRDHLERQNAVIDLLSLLPKDEMGARHGSPAALVAVHERAVADEALRARVDAATTPAPLHPPLTRALVEAWSMTSLEEHTGRTEVEPWLRGWIDREPETTVVWREELPVDTAGRVLGVEAIEAFTEAAGPHLLERLEAETRDVADWLLKRVHAVAAQALGSADTSSAARSGEVAATESDDLEAGEGEDAEGTEPDGDEPLDEFDNEPGGVNANVESDDECEAEDPTGRRPLRGSDVIAIAWTREASHVRGFRVDEIVRIGRDKRQRDALVRDLRGATLLVNTRLGGLNDGLLDPKSDEAVDVTTASLSDGMRALPFRVRRVGEVDRVTGSQWRQECELVVASDDAQGAVEWLVVESDLSAPARSENGRSAGCSREQTLAEHQAWVERHARRLAERLDLPADLAGALALAARLHDEGKQAAAWQRAFRAPKEGGPFAKTRHRPIQAVLGGYRHELGSIPIAERDPRVVELPDDLRDLCLHLIAAHHGNARPLIGVKGAAEPPSLLRQRAQDIALRFARVERAWGPWGLAWLEALLRAADQRASRDNDERGRTHG